ncbi:uncharacterized protein BDW47DRAFT_111638 [Aspergillus candidus]|uniref:Uncharacterized protein n=1 Tax=Aspergillus candidus TaxID=41067 RepID=A0A2I2F2A5_ASPCN|nr:hypothetical protein BDW47DRAFT_111638 [Aspergillus candidus]PLB34772.1 hypothetical protein BDW47DRAFT_111638 [Aspergillus candidus]
MLTSHGWSTSLPIPCITRFGPSKVPGKSGSGVGSFHQGQLLNETRDIYPYHDFRSSHSLTRTLLHPPWGCWKCM